MTSDQPDTAPHADDRRLTITRILEAPRDIVWRAWTEPERIAQWWGPRGLSTRVIEHDFRPGGRLRYIMVAPDGTEYPADGVFQEIVPFERIVTAGEFDEGLEEVIGMELPGGITTSVLFEDAPGGTRVTLHIEHASPEDRRKHEEMGVVAGWNSSLDCLEEHLTASMNA